MLECPSQSPELKAINYLWQALYIYIHRLSYSNPIEFMLFCKEDWA